MKKVAIDRFCDFGWVVLVGLWSFSTSRLCNWPHNIDRPFYLNLAPLIPSQLSASRHL